MTCREKLKLEHPECVSAIFDGSCTGCPADYGYLPHLYSGCEFNSTDECCAKCWDREIPETKYDVEAFRKMEEFYKNRGCPVGEPGPIGEPGIPIIKDSGNRRQFDTGAVRDMQEGKGRMDLLPWAAIMEVSKHCENGAKKYGEHNVDKGLPTSSFCDSAARHLAKYLDGWTDEPHLLAAAWNLLWAIQMELKHPEVVDTPWKE